MTLEVTTTSSEERYLVALAWLIAPDEAGRDIPEAAGGTMGSGYKNPGGEGRGYDECFATVAIVDSCVEWVDGVVVPVGWLRVGIESDSDCGVRMESRWIV